MFDSVTLFIMTKIFLFRCVFDPVNLSFMTEIHSSLVPKISIWLCESFSHNWKSLLSRSAAWCLTQWIFFMAKTLLFNTSVFDSLILLEMAKICSSLIQWISQVSEFSQTSVILRYYRHISIHLFVICLIRLNICKWPNWWMNLNKSFNWTNWNDLIHQKGSKSPSLNKWAAINSSCQS